MIQHVWSVLCQSASFDIPTNRVSLFNTLENLVVLETPSNEKPLIISCEIVSLWVRDKDDTPCSGQMRVSLETPIEGLPQAITLEIDLTRTPFHRTRVSISALPITNIGRFEFQIEYQLKSEETWQLAAKLPFIVVMQKPDNAIPIS